jgi:trimethylamine--corrinoid protein Co-methyltransferase
MFQIGLLSEDQIGQLAAAVETVLKETGIICQNEELLDALDDWGAKVDRQSERVWFPKTRVRRFAANLRSESYAPVTAPVAADKAKLAAQDYGVAQAPTHRRPDWLDFVPPDMPVLSTQVAQFYYDDATGQKRGGSREDLITLIKLGEALHPQSGVGHALLLRESPPLLEPLEAALILAEYSARPGAAFAWHVSQVDYLIEMGEILGIPDWFTWGAICFSHPLRFDRDVADKFVRRARSGVPTGLTGMEVAGATTPVTAAGFIVVSAAEFVAGWIAARALNPTCPLSGSIWGGTVDMKTGAVSYSAPDGMLRAFALSQFLSRWCGQKVVVGGGEYCDAKTPGLYAAYEKAYKAMTIAAYTGIHPQVGEGMLESGKTFSPAQFLLDREVTGALQALGMEIEVSPESIALETIREVGQGLTTNYLQTEHTLLHHRAALWHPKLIDRSGWAGAESDAALLARCQKRVQELVASYKKPEVDGEKLEALRKVVARARRELL